jgi:hypothetical protein
VLKFRMVWLCRMQPGLTVARVPGSVS